MKTWMLIIGLGIFVQCCCCIVSAQETHSLTSAVLQAQNDVKQALNELNGLRDQQAEERKPLAVRLTALQQELAQMREEANRLRMLRGRDEKDRQIMQAETAALANECMFLDSLFREYRRALETRASVAELIWLKPQLAAIDEAQDSTGEYADLPSLVESLLALGLSWNQERIGGYSFEGSALDGEGIEQTGQYAVIGPVAYFVADDSTVGGLAVTESGLTEPLVYTDLERGIDEKIRQLLVGETVTLPVDVSGGDALKVRAAKTGLLGQVKSGGFVMIPLLFVGGLALVLIVYKTLFLGHLCAKDDEAVLTILTQVKDGEKSRAEEQASHLSQPLAALVQQAVRHHQATREQLEEMLHEQVLCLLPMMERHLGTLAVLGGIAPLLGLLGTVTGMIHTFQLVTVFGSGDANLLSGGIAEALITTEFGLIIAIPVLVAHAFLSRRTRRIIGELEQSAVMMVNQLKVNNQ